MHGPQECTGNIQQLCAQSIGKNDTARNVTWFDFDVCQERDRSNIPANAPTCAKQLGMDWQRFSACFTGATGNKLMSDSIKRTKAAGIGVSRDTISLYYTCD